MNKLITHQSSLITYQDGILLVDKPPGPTSHDVVQLVKRALSAGKAGHLGTLDPAATGLLAVCINGATKIAQFFTDHDKEYMGTLMLGVETDTQDAQGEVVATEDPGRIEEDRIREVFKDFTGSIEQRPPDYSAVKVDGKPLYRLARAGKRALAPMRTVQIKELEILSIDMPRVSFRASVSAGTYIRTLAHDIGKKLGVGAHLESLRRTRSGPFRLEDAIPLDELDTGPGLKKAYGALIPMRNALAGWPEILVEGEAARRVAHGNRLTRNDFDSGQARCEGPGNGDMAMAIDPDGRVIAVMGRITNREGRNIGERSEALWRPLRVWGYS